MEGMINAAGEDVEANVRNLHDNHGEETFQILAQFEDCIKFVNIHLADSHPDCNLPYDDDLMKHLPKSVD